MVEHTYSDEQLSAYLDGELPTHVAQKIHQSLENDTALRQRLTQLKDADDMFRDAFSDLVDEPLPDSILKLVETANVQPTARISSNTNTLKLVSFTAKVTRAIRSLTPTTIAASITMVIGLSLGYQLNSTTSVNGEIEEYAPVKLAMEIEQEDPVFNVIETTGSGSMASVNGLEIKPVLTFRTHGNKVCREILSHLNNISYRSIVCREKDMWRMKVAVQSDLVSNSSEEGYITASSASNKAIDEYIHKHMAADPLGAEEEQNLINDGWD